MCGPLLPETPAEGVDFTAQMRHGVPYVIGFVLALAFVLLLIAFRSIVVPIKAIVLNLLSVGASYGVLVLVFQHRWAQGLLGFRSDGAIISWLPLFLFVVLFGLSMDYHVFILSRVREGVDAGHEHRGGASTRDLPHRRRRHQRGTRDGRRCSRCSAPSSSLDLKQAGVGLAVAVLIDSTVVRGVLLPATMKLLGERNWYLPRRLAWLPDRLGQRAGCAPAAARPGVQIDATIVLSMRRRELSCSDVAGILAAVGAVVAGRGQARPTGPPSRGALLTLLVGASLIGSGLALVARAAREPARHGHGADRLRLVRRAPERLDELRRCIRSASPSSTCSSLGSSTCPVVSVRAPRDHARPGAGWSGAGAHDDRRGGGVAVREPKRPALRSAVSEQRDPGRSTTTGWR